MSRAPTEIAEEGRGGGHVIQRHSLIGQFGDTIGDVPAELFLECDIRWATPSLLPGFSLNYDTYKPRWSDGRTNIH